MNQIPENKFSSQDFLQVAGPLLLICSAVLLGRSAPIFNVDLLAILLFGFYLTSKWKVKGFIYSVSFLFISIFFKHLFMNAHHAWQLGLEASVSFGLLVSALCFKEREHLIDFLQTQQEKKTQTIQFLEEDLEKLREKSAANRSEMDEKIVSLQSELEEVQVELSSVQVLNDVLRKTTAKAIEEKDEFEKRICHFQHLVDVSREENQKLQETILEYSNANEIISQNENLLAELNALRTKEAQTALINEQLVHLHATESQKVKKLEEKCFALSSENEITSSQFVQLSQEMQALQEGQKEYQKIESEKHFLQIRLQDALSELEFAQNECKLLQKSYNDLSVERANTSKENIAALESKIAHLFEENKTILQEKNRLQEEIENASLEKESFAQELLQKIQIIQSEKEQIHQNVNLLSEEKNKLESQKEALSTEFLSKIEQISKEKEKYIQELAEKETASKEFEELVSQKNHLFEQLQFFRARLEESSNVEALYRQLKSQFDEKNKILHETRSQLFHIDTQLQTVKQELDQKDLEQDPFTLELREEFHKIEEEIKILQEENLQLHDLVSHLMNTSEIDPLKIVKKKMKKISHDFPEQGSLF